MSNEMKWIPITERLPVESEWYLDCWITYVDITNPTRQPNVTKGYFCGKTGLWRSSGGMPVETHGIHVTAWQLYYRCGPEPYKEDKP